MTTAALIRGYRLKQRADGLCGQVGCKNPSTAYYCKEHAHKHADRQKRRRADAKAAKLAARVAAV